MKKIITILSIGFVLTTFGNTLTNSNPTADFINSLTPQQETKALYELDDESKSHWHFFPGSMIARSGISLGELNQNQQDLVFEMLRYFLSESGYKKVRQIHDLEQVLYEMSGNSAMRDPGQYYVAIYGDPLKDSLWLWSFEGHHLSLNFIICDEVVSIAPQFLGASPATIKRGPRKGERALKNEEDLGFELINSMSASQKNSAIFRTRAYPEIVTFNDKEVSPLEPVGIKTGDLNADQKALLIALINEYVSVMPEEEARAKLEGLKQEELDEIRFGWAGGLKPGEPHYYRIQGKTFLIEFDNTQQGANHIHSVWRDFDGDFGRDLIRDHYKQSNHHKNGGDH